MTQTDLVKALTAERYQPRYLTKPGEEMPPALSFDDLIASLRQEAKKPAPEARKQYARVPDEVRKWQNEEADKFIERRLERERELHNTLDREARRREKKKQERAQKVELDQFDLVQLALSQGKSVKEALSHLEQRRKK